ncbi:MAG TPA: sodium-dependent transporter [Aggregicoccus sp.]|nr:sodium-dependent transporter [Aggregicoccus sp.]
MATSAARAHWSSRLAFILAAAGSAVGLGNIWKFPYITGVNGGGAFVAVYLVCIALVGMPIFIAELYIGRQAQANVVRAFEVTHRPRTPWRFVGWMGLASAFLILSFYSVVGGWVLDFILRSVTNQFAGHSDAEIQGVLGTLFSNPLRQLFWHALFMAATVGIVVQGLNAGLERWNRILMPALFVLLLLLLVRAVFLPGFGQALSFLFTPHTERLTAAGVLEAVGHSFFTLSLGMGAMITYGSYLRTSGELTRTVLSVAALDTLIALAAGVVIFSVVFTFGLEPGSGPTLMFQTLPMLFAKMPGGYLVSLAFFLLVGFAALTSAISLLEVVVSYWVETHGTARGRTALVVGGIVYLLGVLSALSTNLLADVKLLGLTFFDLADKLTSSVTLPLGGALISLFFGWVLGRRAVAEVVGERFATPLLWTVRVLAPLGVLGMLINGLSGW